MKSIKISITGCLASVTEAGQVVSGTVGLPVEFAFDDAWENLNKTAVFRANGKTLDTVDISDYTTVPWELLMMPGCRLWAGVYGTNADGSLQIPTVWADLGIIQPGADPSGDESADPSLPVWEQVRSELGDIDAALDNIIQIQNDLLKYTTFYFLNTKCVAVKGMNWEEWCNSEWNTINAYIGSHDTGDRVWEDIALDSAGDIIIDKYGNVQGTGSIIIDNMVYSSL